MAQTVTVEEIFRRAGAMLEGHFLLTSGRHSARYLEKFLVLQWQQYTGLLCPQIADQFRSAGISVRAIHSPLA